MPVKAMRVAKAVASTAGVQMLRLDKLLGVSDHLLADDSPVGRILHLC